MQVKRGQFLANFILRNPLNGMVGAVELLSNVITATGLGNLAGHISMKHINVKAMAGEMRVCHIQTLFAGFVYRDTVLYIAIASS